MFSLQVIIREVHTAIDLGYCDGFLSSSDAEVPPPLPPGAGKDVEGFWGIVATPWDLVH